MFRLNRSFQTKMTHACSLYNIGINILTVKICFIYSIIMECKQIYWIQIDIKQIIGVYKYILISLK